MVVVVKYCVALSVRLAELGEVDICFGAFKARLGPTEPPKPLGVIKLRILVEGADIERVLPGVGEDYVWHLDDQMAAGLEQPGNCPSTVSAGTRATAC